MKILDLVYLFYIYSFFGYIWEVIWVSANQRKLTNRGFLYGPILPIYGFGAVFITLFVNHAISRLNSSNIVIFISGMFIATVLEYFTGYIIEKIFRVRYWDYTERFMNLKGYICLRSSLFFGVASIIMIKYSNKHVFDIIGRLENTNINYLIYLFLAITAVDVIISIKQAYGFRYIIEYQEKVEEYVEEIKKDVKLKALEKSMDIEKDLEEFKSELKGRIPNVEFKKSFVENSYKILQDRIHREENLQNRLKELLIKNVENEKALEQINKRINIAYQRRLHRIKTHQKNIERVAKRNNITFKQK